VQTLFENDDNETLEVQLKSTVFADAAIMVVPLPAALLLENRQFTHVSRAVTVRCMEPPPQ